MLMEFGQTLFFVVVCSSFLFVVGVGVSLFMLFYTTSGSLLFPLKKKLIQVFTE